jgi:hypothetical protein
VTKIGSTIICIVDVDRGLVVVVVAVAVLCRLVVVVVKRAGEMIKADTDVNGIIIININANERTTAVLCCNSVVRRRLGLDGQHDDDDNDDAFIVIMNYYRGRDVCPFERRSDRIRRTAASAFLITVDGRWVGGWQV